ncbi:DUF2971 domain-containing protein [Limnobacter sp. 130]|uniref:DUF2971 domain-containing protein n=1 Tax=Limnobacter sp. 130 TaxID=2653147 RepID=UPI0013583D10|nr:DUF2971 domain-containing protein [Limnobacter sp. 130]
MDILYHYCNPAAFLSIIGNRCIWLSSLSLSNDAMEGKLVGSTFRTLFDRNKLNEKQASMVIDAIKSLEEVIDGLGFCLSEKGDLLSQWRGYSGDGQGFSIGFSKEYLESLNNSRDKNTPGFSTERVIYELAEHESALQPIFERILQDILIGKLNPPSPPSMLMGLDHEAGQKIYELAREEYGKAVHNMMSKVFMVLSHLFRLKNPAFREEAEWRLISHLFNELEDECEFRISAERLIPFRSIALKNLDIPAIREVILGPKNITPEFVVSKFLEKNGFVGVTVKRSSATYR